MSEERDQALEAFLRGTTGRERSAGDVVVMISEALEHLEELLETAGQLDEDAELAARTDAGAAVFDAAIALGRTCVDSLNGLVISGQVRGVVAPRLAAVAAYAAPLDDGWQHSANPYQSLATVAIAQRGRIAGLAGEPNQLYRRLHEAIALAADVAAWNTWTQLGDN